MSSTKPQGRNPADILAIRDAVSMVYPMTVSPTIKVLILAMCHFSYHPDTYTYTHSLLSFMLELLMNDCFITLLYVGFGI
jgi:hypothetical protein